MPVDEALQASTHSQQGRRFQDLLDTNMACERTQRVLSRVAEADEREFGNKGNQLHSTESRRGGAGLEADYLTGSFGWRTMYISKGRNTNSGWHDRRAIKQDLVKLQVTAVRDCAGHRRRPSGSLAFESQSELEQRRRREKSGAVALKRRWRFQAPLLPLPAVVKSAKEAPPFQVVRGLESCAAISASTPARRRSQLLMHGRKLRSRCTARGRLRQTLQARELHDVGLSRRGGAERSGTRGSACVEQACSRRSGWQC